MKNKLTILTLDSDRFDKLPYERTKEALGIADTNKGVAYIRLTPNYEENKDSIHHEIEELINGNPEHMGEDGVYYGLFSKIGKWAEKTFMPEKAKETLQDMPIIGDIISRGWLGPITQQLTTEGQEAYAKGTGTSALVNNLLMPALFGAIGGPGAAALFGGMNTPTTDIGDIFMGAAKGYGMGSLGAGVGNWLAPGGTGFLPDFGAGMGNYFNTPIIPGLNFTAPGSWFGGGDNWLTNLFGGGGGGGGMPPGVRPEDWARLSPEVQQRMLQTYGTGGGGGGNWLSNLFGGGRTGSGRFDKLLGIGLPIGASALEGYLTSKELKKQREFYEDLYRPMQEFQQAELDLYKDLFAPMTEETGQFLSEQLTEPLSLSERRQYMDIWGPIEQKATERLAGSGMLGQGPAEKMFESFDVAKAKGLEDLFQSKQQRALSNILNFLGRTPTYQVPSAVPPITQDWSGIGDLGFNLADLFLS